MQFVEHGQPGVG